MSTPPTAPGTGPEDATSADRLAGLSAYRGYLHRATRAVTPSPARHGTVRLSGQRQLVGWVVAVAGPVALTAGTVALTSARLAPREPASPVLALAFLALTVLAAYTGGLWPGLAGALLSGAMLNYWFTPPVGTLAIASAQDVIALLLFVVVAVLVASAVGAAARRTAQAVRARHDADTLSMLNQTLLRGDHDLNALVDLVRITFDARAVALLRLEPASPESTMEPSDTRGSKSTADDGQWRVVAASGSQPPRTPGRADTVIEASADTALAVRGRFLSPQHQQVLAAFATHLGVVADRERLTEQVTQARHLEEGNRLRTALLAGVSHDLRTPLAGIKAAVSTLRTPGLTWEPTDQQELLASIESSADRLGGIIENLLDLTRLQTGAVRLVSRDVGLDDVVARAVADVSAERRVNILIPDDLPAVHVDAGLLQRVVANLVHNAVTYAPDAPIDVRADTTSTAVRLLVVDHGPGIAAAERQHMFEPFRRLGDAPAGEGTGLGLAVASGLSAALGGRLSAHDTPGGGLTMVVDIPTAAVRTKTTSFTGTTRAVAPGRGTPGASA